MSDQTPTDPLNQAGMSELEIIVTSFVRGVMLLVICGGAIALFVGGLFAWLLVVWGGAGVGAWVVAIAWVVACLVVVSKVRLGQEHV